MLFLNKIRSSPAGLKNPLTGQNVEDAEMKQYKTDETPAAPNFFLWPL